MPCVDGSELARAFFTFAGLVGESGHWDIEVAFMTGLEWLAGRGYATLGVRFPARYRGNTDDVTGSFLSILWENLPDPIITGRDELGYNKLYADIPEPRKLRGREIFQAAWLNHPFLTIELSDLQEIERAEHARATTASPPLGLLHYKYIPRTGASGADVAYAAFTPPGGSAAKIERVLKGKGSVEFQRSTWEQLPTMFHIVNAFVDLPQREFRGATIVESIGSKDLSDQQALS